jgi:hypothetical protein
MDDTFLPRNETYGFATGTPVCTISEMSVNINPSTGSPFSSSTRTSYQRPQARIMALGLVDGIRPRSSDSLCLFYGAPPVREARNLAAARSRPTWMPICQAWQWHYSDFVRTQSGDIVTSLSEWKFDKRCGCPFQIGKRRISRRKGGRSLHPPSFAACQAHLLSSWKDPSLYAKSRLASGVRTSFYLIGL